MNRRIIEAVPGGIQVVDPQGGTIFSNRRIAEIQGQISTQWSNGHASRASSRMSWQMHSVILCAPWFWSVGVRCQAIPFLNEFVESLRLVLDVYAASLAFVSPSPAHAQCLPNPGREPDIASRDAERRLHLFGPVRFVAESEPPFWSTMVYP
jgi:hypothetical protein